ncbi:MAG: UDP-glucose 4-epimerase GalE [Hyphomicrobiaceae bacterium]|nr:UDP-glucose 4-epimerase GalE [Hyphomicrobiaceae bacterium]
MTVLVTGGAGYIGSHMVLRLIDDGAAVVVLDDLSTGFDWAVHPDAVLVRGSVGDPELVSRLIAEHGVDEIVHFAGSIVVPESVTDPLKYYRNNTGNSRNLIEAAVRGGVKRFVFSSTAAVYGMTGLEPVGETARLDPISPYGRSKLMTEMMLEDVEKAHGLRFGILRYFNVAGADPEMRSGQSTPVATHLIKVAAQTALGLRDHMQLFGSDYPTPDGTCVRDYIHVSDLADAHAALLDRMRESGESYTLNCGYGRGYSVREVIDTVKAVSGVDFDVREAPRRVGDPPAIVAAADRIRSELDWTPRHEDLDQIVEHALGWEKRLLVRNR